MIPKCGRKLNFENVEIDTVDEKQMQLFGEKANFDLQRSLTAVRYKPNPEPITDTDLRNLYDDGDPIRAFKVLGNTIQDLQKRVEELEAKNGI